MIEGIDIFTEYLKVIKKKKIEADYLPQVEKLLKMAMDPLAMNEMLERVSKQIGKIIDRLSLF